MSYEMSNLNKMQYIISHIGVKTRLAYILK